MGCKVSGPSPKPTEEGEWGEQEERGREMRHLRSRHPFPLCEFLGAVPAPPKGTGRKQGEGRLCGRARLAVGMRVKHPK